MALARAATAAYAGLRTASPSHLQGTGQDGTWTKEVKGGRGTPTADAVGQVGELLGVVQHLHALGVGVVAHREGLGDGGCELPDGNRRWVGGERSKRRCLRRVRSSLTPRAYLTLSLAFSKLSATK